MARKDFGRVAAAKATVTCIEQKLGSRAGRGHEPVYLPGRFDHRTHMVVIDQIDALRGGEFRHLIDRLAESL